MLSFPPSIIMTVANLPYTLCLHHAFPVMGSSVHVSNLVCSCQNVQILLPFAFLFDITLVSKVIYFMAQSTLTVLSIVKVLHSVYRNMFESLVIQVFPWNLYLGG